MTQYPNEKGPHPGWLSPSQGASQDPYTSRDGAPTQTPGDASLSQYLPEAPPPQGHYEASQGPPPDYASVQSQDHKSPQRETYLSPPVGNSSPYQAPAPAEAGPSGSSSQDTHQGGLMMSLGAFFGNKGPPPMWHRQPPPPGQLPYNAFPPMCLISNNKDLSNGFPELPPPCQLNPHPFATHDVTEEDWKRFLADIKKAGSLSPTQRIRSNVIPMAMGLSFLSGFMVTSAIEKKMKFKNRQAAGDVIDHWNHYFFGPRRMEVVLSQVSERLSGRLGVAPTGDPNQQRMANGLRQRTDSSDDGSSSSDSDHSRGHDHGHLDRRTRRAARRERRDDRREAKRERRAERRARKSRGDDQRPYELFITSI